MHLHGILSAAYGTGAAPGAAKAGRGGGSASTAADRGLVEEPWMALPDAELTAQQKATKADFVKKLQVRCCCCIDALCIHRCCRAHCQQEASQAESGKKLNMGCCSRIGALHTKLTAQPISPCCRACTHLSFALPEPVCCSFTGKTQVRASHGKLWSA